jgi:predicted DNA-binding transcriptional regulator AlpA
MNPQTHFKTKTEMADACQTSRTTLYTWMKRPDFPPETSHGWERQAVLRFAKDALQRAAKSQRGENHELKAEKIRLECDRLKELIRVETVRADAAEFEAAIRRKEFMAQTDVREMVFETRRMFDRAMACFIERVKTRRDIDLLKWAEQAEDSILLHIRQMVEES